MGSVPIYLIYLLFDALLDVAPEIPIKQSE